MKTINLKYKEPIKYKYFSILFIAIFLISLFVLLYYPSKSFVTNESHRFLIPDCPLWVNIAALAIVILLLSFFLINKFGYSLFVFRKVHYFKYSFGFPLNINKFIEVTQIPEDWLQENGEYLEKLDKSRLCAIINKLNKDETLLFPIPLVGAEALSLLISPDYSFKKKSKE